MGGSIEARDPSLLPLYRRFAEGRISAILGALAGAKGRAMMRCSKCATNNPSTNNFCLKCGNALAERCAQCAAENPPTADFCGKCGARLATSEGASSGDASGAAAVRPLETAERKEGASGRDGVADGAAGSPRVAAQAEVLNLRSPSCG